MAPLLVAVIPAVFLAAENPPDAEGERFAVVIGIDEYQALGKLTVCRNDAKALAKVLVESGGYNESRVIVMTDDAAEPQNRPTLGTMKRRIEQVADLAGEGDTVLVYFSGHGITKDGQGYLVPMDGDANSAVPLASVKDALLKSKAASKVLILDACHAGSAAKGVGGIAPSLTAGAGGLVMLLSSAADQVSYPDEGGTRSVFSKYLAEGLSGAADGDADETVTVAELNAFVNRSMKDWSLATGKTQTPLCCPETPPSLVLARVQPGARPLQPVPVPPLATEMLVPAGCRAMAGTAAEPYTKTGWAKEIVHEATGIELVFIPAGEFLMGSPASEARRDNDETQHRVTLTKGFYLGATEVTQAQWQAVMGSNPSRFKGDGRLPAEKVSWNDCQAFCRKAGGGLRLPTESEWEYACRAGTQTRFSFGDADSALGDYAWYGSNSGKGAPHPVGQKRPNAWGLYDMHGNVWEWCADWYVKDYPGGAVTDPTGPAAVPGPPELSRRVMRGGSCSDWRLPKDTLPGVCRSANRSDHGPRFRFIYLGFRVAVDLK
ncbi:MAG: SUMF1/EgtB/PvdO family nonheme iron enzyme [Phycisphaerae bacterium]